MAGETACPTKAIIIFTGKVGQAVSPA